MHLHPQIQIPNAFPANVFHLKWIIDTRLISTHDNWKKKSESWGPFWSYQLNSTVNPAFNRKIGPNGLNWQCFLAGSFKTAPRILIFFNFMGTDYSFEAKNIEIQVSAGLIFFRPFQTKVTTVCSAKPKLSAKSRQLGAICETRRSYWTTWTVCTVTMEGMWIIFIHKKKGPVTHSSTL